MSPRTKDPVDIAVGERLKKERERLGKTQKQIAVALVMSEKGYRKWESGERQLPRGKEQELVNLGFDPSVFLQVSGRAIPPHAGVVSRDEYMLLKGQLIQADKVTEMFMSRIETALGRCEKHYLEVGVGPPGVPPRHGAHGNANAAVRRTSDTTR